MISSRPDFVHGRNWRELSPDEGKRKYRAEARDMQIKVDKPLEKIISFRDRNGREWARFSGPIFSLSPTYQWNMNSPKKWVSIFGTRKPGWIGTPDCRGDVTGIGGNIQASGFHDAMGQFRYTEHFPLTPDEVDECFYDINRLSGFAGALPYFSTVVAARKTGIWKHRDNGEHSVILHS